MSVLKNVRHEKCAQLVASGKTQADAYRTVFPASRKWKEKALYTTSSELFARREVVGRIQELLEASAAKAMITKEEAIAILAEGLRATPGEVTDKSRFAQEMTIDPISGKVTIRLPSKTAAFSEIAKALGWYAPQEVKGVLSFIPDGPVFERLKKAAEGKS